MGALNTANINLDEYGITSTKALFYNLSYDELYKHETDPSLRGYDKSIVSEFGAVAVDTGKFTGRSAKDKYIVEDQMSKDTVWWATGEASGSETETADQNRKRR